MTTLVLTNDSQSGSPLMASSVLPKLSGWAITLSLMFFACHGAFSFQTDGGVVGGFLPGAVEQKNPGFFGYVAVPAIAYGIVFWHMKSVWRRVASYAARFKLLTTLALLTIISSIWSQDPLRSVEFGIFYLVGTLFAYYLTIRFESAEIMVMVSRAGIILCVVSAILAVAFPQYGLSSDLRSPGSWRGIFLNKTMAAVEIVFMLSPALSSRLSRPLIPRLFFIVFPLFVIVKTHAVTAFVVLVLYMVFLGCLHFGRKLGPKLSLAFIVTIAIGSAVLGIWGFEYLPDLLQSLGRDPTLTGRTIIWHSLMSSIAKRPLLGYGFYSFWQGLNGESGNLIVANNYSFGYAHNGTLEIVLQLGLVGVALFYATLVQAIRNAWYCFRYDNSRHNDWYFGLLVLALLYNLDEATVLLPNDLPSILYVVACCGLGQAAQRIRKAKQLSESLCV